jgi:hypothetical protein
MTAQIAGQITVGQCSPNFASLVAQAMAELNAKLAGALQLQASITITPPTMAASLQTAVALVAALEAQIALSISLGLPEVSVDLTVMLSVVAEINASLAVLIGLSELMAVAGVAVITHTGTAGSHGSEVQACVNSIAPPDNAVQSVTFLATEPAVFAALGAVLFTG